MLYYPMFKSGLYLWSNVETIITSRTARITIIGSIATLMTIRLCLTHDTKSLFSSMLESGWNRMICHETEVLQMSDSDHCGDSDHCDSDVENNETN